MVKVEIVYSLKCERLILMEEVTVSQILNQLLLSCDILNLCFQILPKWFVKSLILPTSPFKFQIALLPTCSTVILQRNTLSSKTAKTIPVIRVQGNNMLPERLK